MQNKIDIIITPEELARKASLKVTIYRRATGVSGFISQDQRQAFIQHLENQGYTLVRESNRFAAATADVFYFRTATIR